MDEPAPESALPAEDHTVALPWVLVAAVAGIALGGIAGLLAAELPEQVSSGMAGQWGLAAAALAAFAVFAWLDRGRARMVLWLAAPLGFLYSFNVFAL
jgi:hypothetical protein